MTRERGFNLSNPEVLASARAQRQKALEDRQRRNQRSVFVVRLPAPAKGFGWEIRQFGSIVLSRGDAEYLTSDAAQLAGEMIMAQEVT